jgi:hypothetical protein
MSIPLCFSSVTVGHAEFAREMASGLARLGECGNEAGRLPSRLGVSQKAFRLLHARFWSLAVHGVRG